MVIWKSGCPSECNVWSQLGYSMLVIWYCEVWWEVRFAIWGQINQDHWGDREFSVGCAACPSRRYFTPVCSLFIVSRSIGIVSVHSLLISVHINFSAILQWITDRSLQLSKPKTRLWPLYSPCPPDFQMLSLRSFQLISAPMIECRWSYPQMRIPIGQSEFRNTLTFLIASVPHVLS